MQAFSLGYAIFHSLGFTKASHYFPQRVGEKRKLPQRKCTRYSTPFPGVLCKKRYLLSLRTQPWKTRFKTQTDNIKMNFFNRALYNLVLSPKALYNRMGVQTDKLALILQVKLMIDDRRPNTFNQRPQKAGKPKKEFRKATLWSIIGSAFMGLFFLYVFAIQNDDQLLKLTLYFSLYIFLLSFTLITEVSNLLLDGTDNTIILPAPVNPPTLLLARLLHILVIILRSGLPMMLPGWVTVSLLDGWKAALVFPWICILAILFTVFVVCSFYLVVLRFVSAQRFKNIIAGIQIFFSIILFAASQLLPRLLSRTMLENLSLESQWWSVYFPAQWFGAMYALVVQVNKSQLVLIGATVSVLVPLLAFFVLIKYLAPAFNRKIGALGGGETEKPLTQKQKVQRKNGRGLANALSGILTRSHTEQAAFRLAWNISSRSREFKMKVYPSLGYLLVYIVVFSIGGSGRKLSFQGFKEMNNAAFFFIMALIYISSFSINTIITQLQMSEKPKAAWVFFTTPLTQPGQVISGAFKAMLAKFLLPICIIVSVAALVLTNGKAAPHLLVGYANVLMGTTLFAYLYLRKFPFSSPIQTNARTGNIILGILVTFLPFGIAVIHGFLRNSLVLLLVLAAISLSVTFFLFQQIAKRQWQSILSTYTED